MREVDLFVIGGGSGGVRAARVAAQHGARVALAEAYRVGGTCVIRGCVPKKLMVLASRFAQAFGDGAAFGWHVAAAPRFSWPDLMRRVHAEVTRLEAVYTANLLKAGVAVHAERALLDDAHTVRLVRAASAFAPGGSWSPPAQPRNWPPTFLAANWHRARTTCSSGPSNRAACWCRAPATLRLNSPACCVAWAPT